MVAFAALVVVVFVVGSAVVVPLNAVGDALTLLQRGYVSLAQVSAQLRTALEGTDATIEQAIHNDDPLARDGLVQAARRWSPMAFDKRLEEMVIVRAALPKSTGDERLFTENTDDIDEHLATAQAAYRAYDAATATLLRALLQDGPVTDETLGWREASESLSRALRGLSSVVEARTAALLKHADAQQARARNTLWWVVGVLLISSIVIGAWLLSSLRPWSRLLDAVRAVKSNPGQTVPTFAAMAGEGEVGMLARELDALSAAVGDRERVLAERQSQMQRLQDFAENVVRSVQVGIIVVDGSGCIRSINPAARAALGLLLRTVEGSEAQQILVGPLAPAAAAIARVTSSGEVESFSGVVVPPRIVDVVIIPVRDRAGVRSGESILFAEDVTQREEARRRALHAERLAAVGRVSAQIAHEIRNPLASIGLNVEMLEDDVEALPKERQSEARTIVRAVLQEVRRLAEITEGHLRVARLPSLSVGATDVGDVVADLVAFTAPDAARAGVQLELRVPSSLPGANIDGAKLRQAVLNLINNAVQAAGQGGTVVVRVDAGDNSIDVHVEDTGPGVPVQERDAVFESFYTTKKGGTGLGLPVARGWAREHGGDLTVTTSALGGAAFWLHLPLSDAKTSP
jgi:PAS domain S-box-containing protein